MIRSSQCISCKHLHPWRYVKSQTCAAFPEEIPRRVYFGEESHRTPLPNDNGIQYEEKIHVYEREQQLSLLATEEPDRYPFALRSISLFDEPVWSFQILVEYTVHPEDFVRAEAMLGLFHLCKNHKTAGFSLQPLHQIIAAELEQPMGTHVWAKALTVARVLESELGWGLNAKWYEQQYDMHLEQIYDSIPKKLNNLKTH